MKGMSLIELMVVTTLIMVLAGGGGVALNTFNEKQKVVAAKDELVASLRLARNAARTAKGLTGVEMRYVKVTTTDEGIVLVVSDSGTTYVDKDVTASGVDLSQAPTGDIIFSPYEARVTGAPYRLTASSGTGETATVIIDSNGLIDGQ